jgi:DNA mismatch endonuclease Vsr
MKTGETKLPSFGRPTFRRSRNMAAIISRGNRTTERRLRALLMRAGVRGWTLHGMSYIGSPDFLFNDAKIAVYVHGCFWHGCLRCGHIPKTNQAYWTEKIARNRRRDRRVTRRAREGGYKVVQIWECELRTRPIFCVERVQRALCVYSIREV